MAAKSPPNREPDSPRSGALSEPAGWVGLEATREFKDLVAARLRFILPATIFFLVYYFALPVLNGVATDFMKTRVVGSVNIAYIFALSQFFMAWILAFFYIRQANSVFDRLAAAVRRRAGLGRDGGER